MTFRITILCLAIFRKILKAKDVCYVKVFRTREDKRLEPFQSATIEKDIVVCGRIHRFRKPDIDFRIDVAIVPSHGTDGIIRFTAVIPDEHFETVLHLLLDKDRPFSGL